MLHVVQREPFKRHLIYFSSPLETREKMAKEKAAGGEARSH